MTTTTAAHSRSVHGSLRTPMAWGVVVGVLQTASPWAFPWLDPATVYALGLAVIAAIYIGFAVADGRPHVLAVETAVASAFVVVAAAAVTGTAWLIVAGLVGHGVKDMWQHRTGFVAGTRWWPPFCATVDVVAAGLIAVAITVGVPSLS
jgi:Na+/melibiose symporter-like transporter